MWGEKKSDAPARTPLPQQPRPNVTTATATSFPGEARSMAPMDAMYNTPSAMGNSGTNVHGFFLV